MILESPKILVVEEHTYVTQMLRSHFTSTSVENTKTIEKIPDLFSETTYDILIWHTDIAKQDKSNGIELLDVIINDSPRTQIIIIYDEDDLDLAIEGLQAGAFQYMKHPVQNEQLISMIELALENQPVTGENTLLKDANKLTTEFFGIHGTSQPMQQVIQQIKEAAMTDISILITGETGTGKDVVASAIHKASHLKDNPYVVVHTGAMPTELIASELFGYEKGAFTGATDTTQGKFEQANTGTIFLDEIGTMDQKVQVSLLRILEQSTFQRIGGKKKIKVDVRVIAATNENLEDMVKQRQFREDLYYRFDVFQIHLPPLRKRAGDISFLAKHFLNHFNEKYNKNIRELSTETMHYLEHYPWPGNVRELKNTIQRAVLLSKGSDIIPSNLPTRIQKFMNDRDSVTVEKDRFQVGMSLEDAEKILIGLTMDKLGANKSHVARTLGISRRALYLKLEKYGLAD